MWRKDQEFIVILMWLELIQLYYGDISAQIIPPDWDWVEMG